MRETEARAEHECAACGGAGTVPGFANYDRQMRPEFDRFRVPCPVCLGSGRISDRMPERDRELDEETARVNGAA